MVSFNFKVLAKFGLCSNCSQKLNGCSLARARKIFATARMLAFSLTCARLLEISLIHLCSYFFILSSACNCCSVLEVSARLLAITWRQTTYLILNRREIPASGKLTKYSKCSLLAICIFLKTLAAVSVFCKVLATSKKNLSTARARKNKHTARMLANARKDHSIPLPFNIKTFRNF